MGQGAVAAQVNFFYLGSFPALLVAAASVGPLRSCFSSPTMVAGQCLGVVTDSEAGGFGDDSVKSPRLCHMLLHLASRTGAVAHRP